MLQLLHVFHLLGVPAQVPVPVYKFPCTNQYSTVARILKPRGEN